MLKIHYHRIVQWTGLTNDWTTLMLLIYLLDEKLDNNPSKGQVKLFFGYLGLRSISWRVYRFLSNHYVCYIWRVGKRAFSRRTGRGTNDLLILENLYIDMQQKENLVGNPVQERRSTIKMETNQTIVEVISRCSHHRKLIMNITRSRRKRLVHGLAKNISLQ